METLNRVYICSVFALLTCGRGASAVDSEMSEGMTTELATLSPILLSDIIGPEADNDLLAKETDLDLANWEAPEWIRKNYPVYLSGYDFEGRPIWIAEWGKFDMRKIAEGGPELLKTYTKYVEKTVQLFYNYTLTEKNPSQEANFIFDFDGLPWDQVSSIPTLRYLVQLGEQYRKFLESKTVARVIALNANFATDAFLRLVKTLFGRFFERMEVFGTNKASWIPQLLRWFPKDQLPEWYGGEKDHKPLLVYG